MTYINLSSSEIAIIRLFCSGRSLKDIAACLGITSHNCKVTWGDLLAKLKVRSGPELIRQLLIETGNMKRP
jgi:DNA-binding CsgD family transcriptional regulator